MAESVIVAALALVGTLAGAYLSNRKGAALIAYRLASLEKRVQAHNSLIERTYRLEERTEVQDQQIRELAGQIGDLKEYHRPR